ncbi:MAG: glycosyltransferase [Thermoleophilia bacterium]
MLRGHDIVCVSSLDWDVHWTSKQQIMHRLSAANRVLYVEEPVTLLAPFRVPERWSRWRALAPSLRREGPGLWVLTPPPLLPFGNLRPWINALNQRLLAAYIRWAQRRLGFREPLLWTYLPTSISLLDRLPAGPVVYHCVDEHSAYAGFVSPDVVRAYDDALTVRADLVITTAENLRASRAPLNPHTFHVPNAADVLHFRRALDPSLEIPDDIAAVPRPRVGVIGVHDQRLDVAALEAIAAADPSWSVVLVGPVRHAEVDEACLRRLPNVYFLGAKPLAEVPAYLKALDVALIPYTLTELSRNIFPLKLYEYLAGGVPVVSAALPELSGFADTIHLAAGPADYPGLVARALAEDGPELCAARVALAARNTWEERVETISELVETMLAARGAATSATSAGAAAVASASAAPAPASPTAASDAASAPASPAVAEPGAGAPGRAPVAPGDAVPDEVRS